MGRAYIDVFDLGGCVMLIFGEYKSEYFCNDMRNMQLYPERNILGENVAVSSSLRK